MRERERDLFLFAVWVSGLNPDCVEVITKQPSLQRPQGQEGATAAPTGAATPPKLRASVKPVKRCRNGTMLVVQDQTDLEIYDLNSRNKLGVLDLRGLAGRPHGAALCLNQLRAWHTAAAGFVSFVAL